MLCSDLIESFENHSGAACHGHASLDLDFDLDLPDLHRKSAGTDMHCGSDFMWAPLFNPQDGDTLCLSPTLEQLLDLDHLSSPAEFGLGTPQLSPAAMCVKPDTSFATFPTLLAAPTLPVHLSPHRRGAQPAKLEVKQQGSVKRRRQPALPVSVPFPMPVSFPVPMCNKRAKRARKALPGGDVHQPIPPTSRPALANAPCRSAAFIANKKSSNYDACIKHVLNQRPQDVQNLLIGSPEHPHGILYTLGHPGDGSVNTTLENRVRCRKPRDIMFLSSMLKVAGRLAKKRLGPSEQPIVTTPRYWATLMRRQRSCAERAEFVLSTAIRFVGLACAQHGGLPPVQLVFPDEFVAAFKRRATADLCTQMLCEKCGTMEGWRRCRRQTCKQ